MLPGKAYYKMSVKDHLNIFIPAYNEEESLSRIVELTVKALRDEEISFTILIGDDGSTDNTALIAQQLTQRFSNVCFYSQDRNYNLGFNFRHAIQEFKEGYFSWIPSDGEIDPELLCELYKRRGENKVIYSAPSGSFQARGALRTLISYLYQLVFRMTFNSRVLYFNGPSLYPLKKLKALSLISEGFAINAEMVLKMKKFNVEYEMVRYALKPRSGGEATALSLSNMRMVFSSFMRLYKSIKGGSF